MTEAPRLHPYTFREYLALEAASTVPCRVHSSDLRVRVLDTGLATYPDVTVVCGPYAKDRGGKAR